VLSGLSPPPSPPPFALLVKYRSGLSAGLRVIMVPTYVYVCVHYFCKVIVNLVYTYLWCFDDGNIKFQRGKFKNFFLYFCSIRYSQEELDQILKDEKVSGHGVLIYAITICACDIANTFVPCCTDCVRVS